MDKVKSYLKSSLLLSFGTIYVVIAWIAFLILRAIVDANNLPQIYITVAKGLTICNGPFVFFALYVIEGAPFPDRKLVFTRTVIALFPLIVIFNFFIAKFIMYSEISNELQLSNASLIKNALLVGLLIAVIYIWGIIYGQFARVSLLKKAQNPEAAMRALHRLNWPLTPEESVDLEIRIAPKLYYSFFAAIAAVIYIVLETVVSEFLNNTFGLAGYISQTFVALSLALVMYPIHKRMSHYVAPQSDNQPESGVDDARSLAIALRNSMLRFVKLLARYWYVPILAMIAGILSGYLGVFGW